MAHLDDHLQRVVAEQPEQRHCGEHERSDNRICHRNEHHPKREEARCECHYGLAPGREVHVVVVSVRGVVGVGVMSRSGSRSAAAGWHVRVFRMAARFDVCAREVVRFGDSLFEQHSIALVLTTVLRHRPPRSALAVAEIQRSYLRPTDSIQHARWAQEQLVAVKV